MTTYFHDFRISELHRRPDPGSKEDFVSTSEWFVFSVGGIGIMTNGIAIGRKNLIPIMYSGLTNYCYCADTVKHLYFMIWNIMLILFLVMMFDVTVMHYTQSLTHNAHTSTRPPTPCTLTNAHTLMQYCFQCPLVVVYYRNSFQRNQDTSYLFMI